MIIITIMYHNATVQYVKIIHNRWYIPLIVECMPLHHSIAHNNYYVKYDNYDYTLLVYHVWVIFTFCYVGGMVLFLHTVRFWE